MKSKLKRLSATASQRVLAYLGYKIDRLQDCDALPFLLYTLLKKRGSLTLVQIGANDGVTSDPLYQFVTQHPNEVRGLLVEPVKDYYDQLVKNYARFPRMKPVNLAIHRTEKQMTINRVNPAVKGLPRWAQGIASFDPSHSELVHIPHAAMTTEIVQCCTIENLLGTHGIQELDLLQIDTEGYDAEIIRGIDFSEVKPKILRFEHGRLRTMPKDVFIEVRERLREHGYEFMLETFDCTAYQPSIVLEL